jgi:SNF2 family DNA or RNA helicase
MYLAAPIESSVIPLPHQIKALSKAVSSNSVRYLLADEVGLGKTIEAGLIMRELKLRGMVKRILIVAPKGLLPSRSKNTEKERTALVRTRTQRKREDL